MVTESALSPCSEAAIGIGRTPVVALSYLLVASWLLACSRYAVAAPKPVEAHELHGAVPATQDIVFRKTAPG